MSLNWITNLVVLHQWNINYDINSRMYIKFVVIFCSVFAFNRRSMPFILPLSSIRQNQIARPPKKMKKIESLVKLKKIKAICCIINIIIMELLLSTYFWRFLFLFSMMFTVFTLNFYFIYALSQWLSRFCFCRLDACKRVAFVTKFGQIVWEDISKWQNASKRYQNRLHHCTRMWNLWLCNVYVRKCASISYLFEPIYYCIVCWIDLYTMEFEEKWKRCCFVWAVKSGNITVFDWKSSKNRTKMMTIV